MIASQIEMPKMDEEEVIKRHMGLVNYMCRRYKRRIENKPWLSYEDLQAIGIMGLIIAYRKYNPAYGVKFSTLACRVISCEISKFLRTYKNDLKCISLDQPNLVDDNKKEITLFDNIVGKDNVTEDGVLIDEIMHILTDRERRIVRATAAGYAQQEIARAEKISQAHVSRILRKINRKALNFMNANKTIENN